MVKENIKEDREKIKEYSKEYREKNKESISKKGKEYREKNKERIAKRKKEYRLKNREKLYEQHRKYRQKPKYKLRRNMKEKIKKKQDIQYLLKCRLRRAVSDALRHYTITGKIMSSKKYGINYKGIIEALKPFPKDIENYHIDHIIPLTKFDLNNPEEIKWAFAPENHQWLTSIENISKGNRKIYKK